jgi:hypothetical protein
MLMRKDDLKVGPYFRLKPEATELLGSHGMTR